MGWWMDKDGHKTRFEREVKSNSQMAYLNTGREIPYSVIPTYGHLSAKRPFIFLLENPVNAATPFIQLLRAMAFIFPFLTMYILINVSFKKLFTFLLIKESCLEVCLRYIC